MHISEIFSAAYIAALLISLLGLPLELPQDSPAWSPECTTFLSGLPEWVAQCKIVPHSR